MLTSYLINVVIITIYCYERAEDPDAETQGRQDTIQQVYLNNVKLNKHRAGRQ